MSDLAKRLGRKIAERVTQSKESGALSPENIDKLKGAAENNARIIAGKVDASARRLAPKVKESVDETKQQAKAHDKEIKSGAKEGAKVLSELATPPILRPAVKAFLSELEEETKDPETETRQQIKPSSGCLRKHQQYWVLYVVLLLQNQKYLAHAPL